MHGLLISICYGLLLIPWIHPVTPTHKILRLIFPRHGFQTKCRCVDISDYRNVDWLWDKVKNYIHFYKVTNVLHWSQRPHTILSTSPSKYAQITPSRILALTTGKLSCYIKLCSVNQKWNDKEETGTRKLNYISTDPNNTDK